MNRRAFLAKLALSPWAAQIAQAKPKPAPGPVFPCVEPAQVGVDATRLAALTNFLRDEHEKGAFPGALVMAIRDGKTFLSQCWGTYCSVDRADNPLDTSVHHMMYSFSKVITATVAVTAHQDGLIDYDVPLSTYIPEFKGGGKDGITLRHLMTHSAGIPTAKGAAPVWTEGEWSRAIAALCQAETEWPPGSRTAYHALSGMLLTAEAIRRVSGGAPWEDLCRQRLLDPIGAAGMTFRPSLQHGPIALSPQPKELPSALDENHFALLGHPAGGAVARPEDMLRLLQLHLDQGKWQGKRLLAKKAFREMHRVQYAQQIEAARNRGENPTHEYWALGWLTRGATTSGWFGFGEKASPRAFGHAGINTVIGIADPERDTAWVFLTTDSPKTDADTVRLRNTVSDLLIASVK